MAGLQEFRTQHPEYNDIPDTELADKLYSKFYSDMPREQFDAKMGMQAPAPQQQDQSFLDAIASQYQQFYKGLGHGMADPLYGVAQLGMQGVDAAAQYVAPESGVAQKTAEWRQGLDETLKANEARYQSETQQNPAWAGAGRVAGNVATTAPAASMAPATLPGAIAVGAGTGAVMPVTEGDYWSEKGLQTLYGAGGGAAGNVIGRTLSRVIAPQTDDAVKALMNRGVRPTPGQIAGGGAKAFEEKLTSYPIVGDVVKAGQRRTIEDFNKAVYDDVLKHIGGKAPQKAGREAVKEIGDQIGAAYDDVLSRARFTVDRQFADELTNLRTLVNDLPDDLAKTFDKTLKQRLAKQIGRQGNMDGRTFKEVESYLGKEASRFSGSTDAFQKKLGDAYKTLLGSLRDGLERSNKGDVAKRLKDVNTAFAKHVRLEKAAGMQGGDTGIFTPAQLSSAVKAADRSSRKRAFARGDALLQDISDPAKEVIGNVYPDSGTAGRLAALLLAGGAGAWNPYLALPGVAALPYTRMGQRLTGALMTKRPAFAPAAAEALRRGLPAVSAGSAAVASKP